MVNVELANQRQRLRVWKLDYGLPSRCRKTFGLWRPLGTNFIRFFLQSNFPLADGKPKITALGSCFPNRQRKISRAFWVVVSSYRPIYLSRESSGKRPSEICALPSDMATVRMPRLYAAVSSIGIVKTN